MKQLKWVRFVVAVFVALWLAFLPMLSQQAMAGHHVNDDISLDANVGNQEHASAKSGSCAEKSGIASTDLQINCCDMNCSNFDTFEAAILPALQLQGSEHFEIDAEQLTSRILFGLMRPPRA